MTVCDAHKGMQDKLTQICTDFKSDCRNLKSDIRNVESKMWKMLGISVTIAIVCVGALWTTVNSVKVSVEEMNVRQQTFITKMEGFIRYAPPEHKHTEEGIVIRRQLAP